VTAFTDQRPTDECPRSDTIEAGPRPLAGPARRQVVFRQTLAVLLCLVLIAANALAQSEFPNVLTGTVRDSTGAVLVGAGVVITKADGSDPVATVTDATGQFAFRGLAANAYRITASAAGFAESARTIEIGRQRSTSIEFVLKPAVVERVEVTTQGGLSATMITGAALAALPDDPGGLLQRVRELAGATDSLGQVEVTVDGFPELLWLPPKQAIQAIKISSNWFAPEFAEPGQARVDIITKPGGARVRGDFNVNFNDEALNARNALAPDHPPGHMRDVKGYLSGPIVPGRLSFVVYGGRWNQEQNSVINATVLDPNHAPASLTDTVPVLSRVDNVWLGTTLQAGSRNTLAVSFSATSADAENLGLEGGLDLEERSYRRTSSSRALRATLTSVASPRVFNELRVQFNPQRSAVQADSAAPAVMVLDAFTGGGNQEALLSVTQPRETLATDTITIAVPRHTLKFGADVRWADRQYIDKTNAGGSFVFGADVERDAAGIPLEDSGGERLVISPLERYRRTVLGVAGYTPSQFFMTRGEPEVRFRETAVGVYAQDDWIPNQRLTLSYGVRSEWQTAASQPSLGLRAGVALALDDARKNVLRVGAGTFYRRIEPELTLDVTRLDGVHQEQVLIQHPSFFPTVPPSVGSVPALTPSIYVKDSELRSPQVMMSAASYERQLTTRMFMTMKYGFQRGTDLLRTRNVNAPDLDGVRPEPDFGQVLQYESTGRLQRHELSAGWRWNTWRDSTLFANYSHVHARSDTDGRTTIPADGSRLDQEFGSAAADRRHWTTVGANLMLPGALFVSPYLTAGSGRVFNLTTGFDNNGDGVFTDRPAVVAAGTLGAIQTPYGWLLADRPYDAVMVARNAGREPWTARLDVRVLRSFRFSTTGGVTVAANIENVLNRANYEGFNGVVTSSSFDQPKRAGTPRRISLAASVSF